MARWVLTLLGGSVLIALTQSGCAASDQDRRLALRLEYPHARMESLTETSEEHYQRISRISDQYSRVLADDLDLFFLTDRPSRLTRWHSK